MCCIASLCCVCSFVVGVFMCVFVGLLVWLIVRVGLCVWWVVWVLACCRCGACVCLVCLVGCLVVWPVE